MKISKIKLFFLLLAVVVLAVCAGCDTTGSEDHKFHYPGDYMKDDRGHWRDCQADFCTFKVDYAEHSFNSNGYCSCGYFKADPENCNHEYEYESIPVDVDDSYLTHRHRVSCKHCKHYFEEPCDMSTATCVSPGECDNCKEFIGRDAQNHEGKVENDRWTCCDTRCTHINFDDEYETVEVKEDILGVGYKCNSCEYVTASSGELEAHFEQNPQQENHGGYVSDVELGLTYSFYTCSTCGYGAGHEGFMIEHSLSGHTYTERKTKVRNALASELIEGVYVISGFCCEECYGEFLTEAAAAEHASKNDGHECVPASIACEVEPLLGYACSGCDYTVDDYSLMKGHADTYDGEAAHQGVTQMTIVTGTKTVTQTRLTGGIVCKDCGKKIR